MKERFTKEPVLAAPDIDKKMRMEVDVSDYATGGVLSMECKDGLWRPVAFLSKLLNETERNYEIHDKEMLAIVRGLEAWRHLLEGAQYKFEIWTDHKNLEYFMKAQKLNRRQARWALYLSRFDFCAFIKYSRFLWSVHISNLYCAPSNKCLHASNPLTIANISLSCIS